MSDIRDHIFDDIYHGFTTDDKKAQRLHIGRAIKQLWRVMDDERWRARFIEAVTADEPDVDMMPKVFPDLRDDDLEYIAHWWPQVRKSIPPEDEALNGMAMNFSKCIRTGRSPSGKIIKFAKAYFRDWRMTQNADGVLTEDYE